MCSDTSHSRPGRFRKPVIAVLMGFSCALAFTVIMWAEEAVSKSDSKPVNVLLIVIDTLRADHLSSYGYERPTTPNLDRIASEGVLYEECISAASWTLPAHASLFTGLFPRDHYTTSEQWRLQDSFETLAERLGAAGYQTAGFSNNVWTNDQSGLKQGFDTFEELFTDQDIRTKGISFDNPETDMGGKKTTERILTWIDGLEDKERPFFVFVNYFEPHLPYRPTRPFDQHFLPEGVDKETVKRLRSFYSPREYAYILDVPIMKVSDHELEILTSLYDAEIAYSDYIVGSLVEQLEERALLEDTLLVITSDHGEHLGENHMLSHKLSVYDPLLRVPMILRNPGRIPSEVRVETQVQAHDVFGTILEVAGIEYGGRRLPWKDERHAFTFAELDYPRIFIEIIDKQLPGWNSKAFQRALKTVRGERFKLIWGSDGHHELYDLLKDPSEAANLADSQPDELQEMLEILQSFNEGAEASRHR